MGIILSIVCLICFGLKGLIQICCQSISSLCRCASRCQKWCQRCLVRLGWRRLSWRRFVLTSTSNFPGFVLSWTRCYCCLCCLGAIVVAVVVDLCRSEYQVTSMFTGKSASRRRGRTAGRREAKHHHHNTSLEICQNIFWASSRIPSMNTSNLSKHLDRLCIRRFEPREVIVQRCEPTVKHVLSALHFLK